MSLADAVEAHKKVQGTSCSLCLYLDTLTPNERAEWVELLNDQVRFPSPAVQRYLRSINANVAKSSVENHRAAGHP